MAETDTLGKHSGIKVNVGYGLSLASGWLDLDNSLSVRVARWPIISCLVRCTGFLAPKSAELAEMPTGPTSTDGPGQLDLRECEVESSYVEAVRPR
jgi:hypothetical protein